MNFKSYTKAILESKNAQKKNLKNNISEEDEIDSDEGAEKENGIEASVDCKKHGKDCDCDECKKKKFSAVVAKKNDTTGKDPSIDTGCAGKTCKKSLRESIQYSARYSNNTISEQFDKNILNEAMILNENINNNSASKILAKLAKKAEIEAAKYANKDDTEKANIAKQAASNLREASKKLFQCESRYQMGDTPAKVEYKKICKEYKGILEKAAKKTIAGRLKRLALVSVGATAVLGLLGTTAFANEKVLEKLQYGISNPKHFLDVLKDIGENNSTFIKSVKDDIKDMIDNKTLPVAKPPKDLKDYLDSKKAPKEIFDAKALGWEIGDKVKGAKKAIEDGVNSIVKFKR